MDMDHAACYRAIQARDRRFDGRLFVGVRTTGIYCRPICPARTPKRVNVLFYSTAAAAQEAGFRPCLRCRPEMSPDLIARTGASNIVSRALRLMENGVLDGGKIEALATRVGISERQLRRLFANEVGASPKAVSQTYRVHLAKQLIHDTQMPMVDVALASGFGSVRRFNETFKQLYDRPPASLRRQRQAERSNRSNDAIMVRLPYSPPYDWDQMVSFFAHRAIPGVELVTGDTYVRSVCLGGACGVIAVSPSTRDELIARIHFPKFAALPAIIGRIRRVFDLAADPHPINTHLSKDRVLAPLIAARPGLRVAGAWDGFELAVRGILGQQITVVAARGLAGKLAARYGRTVPAELRAPYAGITHVFPTPEAMMDGDIASLGMPGARGRALASLARTVAQNPDLLSRRNTLMEAVLALRSLPGIGEWTAQYIAMRELREPDAFPAADVGLMRAMGSGGKRPSAEELAHRAEAWRPWRAYAAAHLWASLTVKPPSANVTQAA
jgi:AraC family transcriptional regulator of adaptative response / DNA-3-methyladenine glycosylase II